MSNETSNKEKTGILNVAIKCKIQLLYRSGMEVKSICPFCDDPNLMLNIVKDTYHCLGCGHKGYGIGLYSKIKNITTKQAYIDLISSKLEEIRLDLQSSDFSINDVASIESRDLVYREFLNSLQLSITHRKFLEEKGLNPSIIGERLYKTGPTSIDIRRKICKNIMCKRLVITRYSRILSR